jgi:hypothetical protein
MSEEAHVWLPAASQMVNQVYMDHTPCSVLKKAVAVMSTTVFLLLVPS